MWILIVMITTLSQHDYKVVMQEFNTLKRCMAAGQIIQEDAKKQAFSVQVRISCQPSKNNVSEMIR